MNNFDEWCYARQIRGNYKEALYHHILATREGDAQDDPEQWTKAWEELLSEMLERLK